MYKYLHMCISWHSTYTLILFSDLSLTATLKVWDDFFWGQRLIRFLNFLKSMSSASLIHMNLLWMGKKYLFMLQVLAEAKNFSMLYSSLQKCTGEKTCGGLFHSFVHSFFLKYLFNIYEVSGSMLKVGDTTVKKDSVYSPFPNEICQLTHLLEVANCQTYLPNSIHKRSI